MKDNPYDSENEDGTDRVTQEVVDDFDPADFVESYLADNDLNPDSVDPSDHAIDKDELLSAIDDKLLSMFSERDDAIDPPTTMKHFAEKLLPKVIGLLSEEGFIIEENEEDMFDEPALDEEWDTNDDPEDNSDIRQSLKNLGSGLDDGQDFFGHKELSDEPLYGLDDELDEEEGDNWMAGQDENGKFFPANPKPTRSSRSSTIGKDEHGKFYKVNDNWFDDEHDVNAEPDPFEGEGMELDEFDEFDGLGDERILSREDVLLPSKNKDASLKREVTKPKVTDPVTGDEEDPNDDYIQRIRSLSGLSTNVNKLPL